MPSELVFTPAAVLDLLVQLDELKDYEIGMTETLDNSLQLTVGDSVYTLSGEDATEVSVPNEAIAQVEDANMEAYEGLEASGDVNLDEPVESGILKTIGKALAIGGLVLLGKKLLSD